MVANTKYPNIVVLQYADNNCYPKITTVEDAKKKHTDFSVDIKRNEWEFEGKKSKIGRERISDDIHPRGYGVIGVYHNNSIEELDSMAHTIAEKFGYHGSILED